MSGAEERIVRYKSKPLTQEQLDELDALSKRPDSEIDLSDIPELSDEFFRHAKRGAMYRLVKKQTTLRLDADVLDWFKRHAKDGKGYQTDINQALRDHIAAREKTSG